MGYSLAKVFTFVFFKCMLFVLINTNTEILYKEMKQCQEIHMIMCQDETKNFICLEGSKYGYCSDNHIMLIKENCRIICYKQLNKLPKKSNLKLEEDEQSTEIKKSLYKVDEKIEGKDFISKFNFETSSDINHGAVSYQDLDSSIKNDLISFPSYNQKLKFRTDIGKSLINTHLGNFRRAVKLVSKKKYNGGLFILDSDHMPEGKAVSTVFRLIGANWPCNGEIDIIEYYNSYDWETSNNLSTLHTGQNCVQDIVGISNNGNCGDKRGKNICTPCSKFGGDCPYKGCGIFQTKNTVGNAFNKLGGGIYALEWEKEGRIRLWYFNRMDAEKYKLNENKIDISKWPIPYANFKSCIGAFSDMNIVINTSLCGDRANKDFSNKDFGNCDNFIADAKNIFSDAYWLINSLRIYYK